MCGHGVRYQSRKHQGTTQKWRQDVRCTCSSGKYKHNTTQIQDLKVLKTQENYSHGKRRTYLKVYLRKMPTQASKTSFFRATVKTSSGLKADEVKRALVGFQEVPPGLRPKVATCLAKVSLLTYLVRISALFKVPKTFRTVIIPDVTSSWTNKCRSWT